LSYGYDFKVPPASLRDVEVKIEFASNQLHALDAEFDKRREAGEYRYSPDIRRGGLHHVYKAMEPPSPGRYWGAQIGAVAHALRSSLENLAWQLVIANGGTPNDATHFPIYKYKPDEGKRLDVIGRVPSEALKIIETAQPYNGTEDGARLGKIHALDIFDKHRELVVTAACVHLATMHGPAPLPENVITFRRRTLTNDNVVAIVKYVEPRSEPYLNLSFEPYLTFGGKGPYRDDIVSGFEWDLFAFIQDDFVPRFHQWVPPDRRPTNLQSGPRHLRN
jgi:hypothetical protein